MKAILELSVFFRSAKSPEELKRLPQSVLSTVYTLTIDEGQKVDPTLFGPGFGNLSIEIETVSLDSLKIRTNGLVPEREGQGLDLRTNVNDLESEIAKGQTLELATQTMDGGGNYKIKFIDARE